MRAAPTRPPTSLVALFGVDDVVVVATEDDLVARRENGDGLKRLAKAEGDRAAVDQDHIRAPAVGLALTLDLGNRHQVKRIVVSRRTAFLQMHHHRAEHWSWVACAPRE